MKLMLNTIFITLLTSAMAMPALAGKGPHHDGDRKFMDIYDANSDQQVTQDEFTSVSSQKFLEMDTDNNGMVTAEEMKAYIESRKLAAKQERFSSHDVNADNVITVDEYVESARQKAADRFAELDADSNGQLAFEEYDRDDRRGDREDEGKEKDKKHKDKHGKRDDKKEHQGDRFFGRLDANKDGVVSFDESSTAWNGWFTRLDSNGDGVVTQAEVEDLKDRIKR